MMVGKKPGVRESEVDGVLGRGLGGAVPSTADCTYNMLQKSYKENEVFKKKQ